MVDRHHEITHREQVDLAPDQGRIASRRVVGIVDIRLEGLEREMQSSRGLHDSGSSRVGLDAPSVTVVELKRTGD